MHSWQMLLHASETQTSRQLALEAEAQNLVCCMCGDFVGVRRLATGLAVLDGK